MNKYIRKQVLFEDDDYVFVNKTANLLSVPDRHDVAIPNLKSMLKEYYGEIFTLHRLDKNTSGVIVFAKSKKAHALASAEWQDGKVIKKYMAITSNVPPSHTGTIEAAIREHKTKKGTYVVSNLGKESLTEYEVVEQWGEYALLNVKILTGRTHQIRVHLAYIGCPLLVDPTYGYQSSFYLSSIKKKKVNLKKGMDERPLLNRTPLHASSLTFNIKETKKKYHVESEMPKDMRAIKYQMVKRYGNTEPSSI